MNRKQRREFYKANNKLMRQCPHCYRPSIGATDTKGIVRCVKCGKQLLDKPMDKQCFYVIPKQEAQ